MLDGTDWGRALRDAGAVAAVDHAGVPWKDRAEALVIEFFMSYPDGALFESAREFAMGQGLGAPPSPNAWGAVALNLSRRKRIVRTGVWSQSASTKSHARMQPNWRIALP